MNIGIFSFFNNKNHGSELQAIALQSKLISLGHVPTHLKVCEKNNVRKYCQKSCELLGMFKESLFHPSYLSWIFYWMRQRLFPEKKISQSFDYGDFSRQHLRQKAISLGDMKSAVFKKEFDMFICGSDQIWSSFAIPFTTYRYLPFIENHRKMAYAVSFGSDNIPPFHLSHILKSVNDYRYLSVREKNAQEFIFHHLNREVPVVLDPTLLFRQEEWLEIIQKETQGFPRPKNYGLVYFLGKMSSQHIQWSNELFRELNVDSVSVLSDEIPLNALYKEQRIACDPYEFLRWVADARFIVTDSFHGTVFSILFNKPFISFSRTHHTLVKQTIRITSLLETLDIGYRFAGNTVPTDWRPYLDTGYSGVMKRLEERREFSMEFLEASLSQIESSL